MRRMHKDAIMKREGTEIHVTEQKLGNRFLLHSTCLVISNKTATNPCIYCEGITHRLGKLTGKLYRTAIRQKLDCAMYGSTGSTGSTRKTYLKMLNTKSETYSQCLQNIPSRHTHTHLYLTKKKKQ